jgi:hypothetical protein
MTGEIHVGDVGTSFRVTLKNEDGSIMNLQNANNLRMWFSRPDGSVLDKQAVLVTDGTDGKMEYIVEPGDINLPGNWKVQAVVGFPSGMINHSEIQKFKVYPNLK